MNNVITKLRNHIRDGDIIDSRKVGFVSSDEYLMYGENHRFRAILVDFYKVCQPMWYKKEQYFSETIVATLKTTDPSKQSPIPISTKIFCKKPIVRLYTKGINKIRDMHGLDMIMSYRQSFINNIKQAISEYSTVAMYNSVSNIFANNWSEIVGIIPFDEKYLEDVGMFLREYPSRITKEDLDLEGLETMDYKCKYMMTHGELPKSFLNNNDQMLFIPSKIVETIPITQVSRNFMDMNGCMITLIDELFKLPYTDILIDINTIHDETILYNANGGSFSEKIPSNIINCLREVVDSWSHNSEYEIERIKVTKLFDEDGTVELITKNNKVKKQYFNIPMLLLNHWLLKPVF